MGSGSSKRRLKEQEEENKKLRGRLHEIPQKNEELKRLKQELDRAKKRLANSALAELERENSDLKNTNHELLEELQQAKSEADMYRSVSDLSRTSRTTRTSTAGSYGRISLTEMRQSEKKRQARMQGISAEPGKYKDADVMNRDLEKFPKDQRVKELIREAINENDFLQHLQEDQINEIIDCMQPTTVQPGVSIIKEGEDGDKLYVIESGEAKVTKRKRGEDEFLRTMREKTLFGELAILYSTPRTASCTAITKCNLWNLERVTFQIIMMKTGLLKSQDRLEMIKRIPRFRNNSEELLTQIIDAFDENQYELDEYIVRQGAKGETFYIIVSGKILARKTHSNGKEERRYLKKGDWFGEKALDGEEVRQESMMVTSPEGVTCLCMDRDTLKAIMEKNVKIASGSAARRRSTHLTATVRDIPDNLKRTRLGDLCIIETLGVGGFGRVELVQVGEENSQTYALKQIKKCHVVEMKQQDHILNERRILLECKSEFIIRLYRTYRNNKFVYMLMDASLGGELWRHLRDRGPFNDTATRFYTACTMEALDYLHARGIVYRDLKPENLLMSANGYVKLVDFGFAKKIGHGKKTWTFCGTPEYVAPEIILNKGHDFAVDLWSLGILMYELLTGNPPFSASDPMKTYNMILKGVDAINIPRRVSKNAKDLIKKLCREQASERLGYSRAGIVEVQKHKWFDGFNWEGLRSRKVEPPSKPTIRNATDTGNFDEYPEENDPVPEETSDWDREFAEQF